MQKARAVICEALLVALAGIGFGLLANAVSPHGLRPGRDYFPRVQAVAQPAGSTNGVVAPANDPEAPTRQRLQQRGLQAASSNEVVEIFRDPRYQQGLFVFVDARDDAHYQAGHVPGAWQFNHYRAEQFLPMLLPLCLAAQKVVVYCTGGACEDSEFAALMLRDGGVPAENLYVYIGGMAEWTRNALPIETGVRGSSQFAQP